MTQDPLFELTRSPQLNVLINRTKEFYENTITDAEFKESIKSLNSFRREFRTFLREQIKFNVMTPLVKEQTEIIEHSLEKIREGLEEMYSYFNDRKQEHIDSGLTKCKSAFEKLHDSIESIQKEEKETQKTYSNAPLQNELMRIGYALIDGKVSPDAFKIKLDSLKNSLRMYYGYFDNIVPQSSETEFLKENGSLIKNCVRDYIKALEEASIFFKDLNTEHIKVGLKKSNEAAEKLIDFQNRLNELKSVKNCFRCGTKNPATAKVCSSCGATLPVMAEEESGESIDLRVDENDNINNTTHAQTELTKKVSDIVSDFKHRKISSSEAKNSLSKIIDSVAQTKKDKDKLQIPNELKENNEYSSIFNKMEDLMVLGLKDMEEGLTKINNCFEIEDDSQIDFGLEQFFSGADNLSKVVVMSESLKNM